MKTNTRGPSTRRTGLRAALMAIGVGAVLTVIGGLQSASAQSIGSFQLLTDVTPFRFNVNDTAVSGNANLNSLLSSTSNKLEVGWTPPPQGSPIEFKYTGPNGGATFGVSLNTGDILKVYSVAGAYFTNESGFATQSETTGSTLTDWSGNAAALPASWSPQTSGNPVSVTGYEKGSPFSSPLTDTIAYTNTGTFDGKDFTGAHQYGTFKFGGITLDNANTATYLGLDVFGDVFDSQGNLRGSSGQTGRIRVTDFSPTPEGSSLLLLACGLVPLVGLKVLIRRRNSPVA